LDSLLKKIQKNDKVKEERENNKNCTPGRGGYLFYSVEI
jgi:hypothetical protein